MLCQCKQPMASSRVYETSEMPYSCQRCGRPIQAEAKLRDVMNEETHNFLMWLNDRLINFYGESPNVDYLHKLRSIAWAMKSEQSVVDAIASARMGKMVALPEGVTVHPAVPHLPGKYACQIKMDVDPLCDEPLAASEITATFQTIEELMNFMLEQGIHGR